MHAALIRAAAALGAVPDGPGTWGWKGRTLSSPARHPDYGPCWLRLAAAPAGQAHGKTWDGTRDAQKAFGAAVRRPALHAVHDHSLGGRAYRAELSRLVPDPVLAPEPVLRTEPDLPGTWWKSLRASIDAVAAVSTSRVAVRQEWADRAVPEFLGIPAPQITRWATAHGDLHPANLTAGDEPWLLDWEGFGTAPAGYDAAMLHAYALMTTGFAHRVRHAFPVLAAPEGRTAQVIVVTELLQSASRGDHPDLVPALLELAAALRPRAGAPGI
jgi:hypothetical protein